MKKQFWILEIVRRDWCLALYHGLLGKHLVAIDKGVELLNHFFAQCPVPRTIVSFACQGNYIGMAKKCKHSILALHSKKTEITQAVYRSGSKPKCVAEKRLVYETLALLNTVVYISGRTFTHAFVYAVKSLVTTNIVNKIIENNIHMCKD